MKKVTIRPKTYELNQPFVISRGSRVHANVVECHIEENGNLGIGECTPYAHYTETVESVIDQIKQWSQAISQGLTREKLEQDYPAGAARHAIDAALWDLESKQAGLPIWKYAGLPKPKPIQIAMTISINKPNQMAQQAIKTPFELLKLKCAGDNNDAKRLIAVRDACPTKKIIVDANESWNPKDLDYWIELCQKLNIYMVEQPFASTNDDVGLKRKGSFLVCADESCHTVADLRQCQYYDVINIKLDKTGGLTHALKLYQQARALGLKIMVGCMLGSGLGIRQAYYLAQLADMADLDAPLLLNQANSQVSFKLTPQHFLYEA